MTPTAEEQIRFLQNVQRILEEGIFTASYKYALLLALADIAVERGDDSGAPLKVSITEIAEKFVQYYLRQAKPYHPGVGYDPAVLWQNSGRQAAIITFVGHHQHATFAQLRRNQTVWSQLVTRSKATIVDQPLWKLQRVGDTTLEFLYPHTGSTEHIELNAGVAFCLRKFYALLYDLVTGAWVRFVRSLKTNRSVLGHSADLAEFLFGSERASLARYRPILYDAQQGRCFYCTHHLGDAAEVDHFIPWSRYPVDLGHNFVLAHRSCNGQKRDRLAAVPHLESWSLRNEKHKAELVERFDGAGILHDAGASTRVAHWAYTQADTAGSLVWLASDRLVPLPPDWAVALRPDGHQGS